MWLRLLRAVECWLAVVSRDDADTPSLRGAMLGAEGESDFTAGPVAPENKRFVLMAATGSFQRVTQRARISKCSARGAGRFEAAFSAAKQLYIYDCVLCLTLPQYYHWLCKELQDLQRIAFHTQSKLLS